MRTGAIPFQFDISSIVRQLMRRPAAPLAAVTFQFPFVTVLAEPRSLERRIAAEILIRTKDRRVLSSWECCDNCIDNALRSLQEIRSGLVEKQVELITETDGILNHIIELMLVAIRQFLTFEQTLSGADLAKRKERKEFHRPPEDRQTYFDALELLRGHLSRCLGQIAIVAGMNVPSDGLIAGYQGPWQLEAYIPLADTLRA